MTDLESTLIEDFTFDYAEGVGLENKQELPTICSQCKNNFSEPVVLNCLHIFDRGCLSKFECTDSIFPVVTCPKCHMQSGSLSSLKPYITQYAIESKEINVSTVECNDFKCVLCTSGEDSKYKCVDCAGLLCERCKILHKEVKFLNSHLDVEELTEEDKIDIKALKKHLADNKPVKCEVHCERKYTNYCIQCGMLACSRCLLSDHVDHSTVLLQDFPEKIRFRIGNYIENCIKAEEMNRIAIEKLNNALMEVNNSHDENKTHIEEVCNEWKTAIDDIKTEYLKKNKELHDDLEFRVMNGINRGEKYLEHIEYALEFTKSYLDKCSNVEFCKIIKVVLNCLTDLSEKQIDIDVRTSIPFKENCSSITNVIRTNFGIFLNSEKIGNDKSSSVSSMIEFSGDLNNCFNSLTMNDLTAHDHFKQQSILQTTDQFKPPNLIIQSNNACSISNGNLNFDVNPISPTNAYPLLSSSGHLDGLNSSSSLGDVVGFPYQGQFENRAQFDDNGVPIMPLMPNTTQTSPVPTFPPIDTFNGSASNGYMRPGSTGYNPNPRPPFPNRGNQCAAMTVKARWGSLGSGRGEMSSPHGFCLGFSEEIVVADTQNHRIQIFTKDGQFLSQFGVAGRDEGQLWFPRKVAIIRSTQRYVVCDRGNERSRMQIFGRSGHFLRKISIRYIDIVAGLAVNNMGHIVAVDSVSPSVFVVSEGGELIKWFDCSSCMREPSDIAVHGDEYFICDFKGHCVCVFKQDGTFVQRFGNETITNFPNGIDVSDHGDVLIGDSHGNRFHIAVYSHDGKLMSEFECPSVKVSRACGLKITSEGYLVTLAKNNHHVLVMDTLYIS